MWLGEMADQGLIVGLKSMQGDVENASTGVSEGAIKAARDTIEQIADFIETDATLHPQITPIVDMTDCNWCPCCCGCIFSKSAPK